MIAARLTFIPREDDDSPVYVACDCGWWESAGSTDSALARYSEHVGGPIHSKKTDPPPTAHGEEPF